MNILEIKKKTIIIIKYNSVNYQKCESLLFKNIRNILVT